MSEGEPQPKSARGSYLAQLQFPLIFFGLSLLVVEGCLGLFLVRCSYSEHLAVVLISWMAMLFLITVVSVTFLTYKVPHHLMLRAQGQINQEVIFVLQRSIETLRHLSGSTRKEPHTSKAALDNLEEVITMLKGTN